MNEKDLYSKLVDLYAGKELPTELETVLEERASQDGELAQEMHTLRGAVEALHNLEAVDFTEESYQRVLMKLYARGAEVQVKTPVPIHLQYQLPIQG